MDTFSRKTDMAFFKVALRLALLLYCSNVSIAEYYLKSLSYTRLSSTAPPKDTFAMFSDAAKEAAYDPLNEMLYTVGESGLLHIIDISNPESPKVVVVHEFSPSGDGRPHDVAVCGSEVAVVVASPVKDVYEGHIYFYHALRRGETQLRPDGKKLPVGPSPHMVTFSPSCQKILVANEGKAGKDISNKFMDPLGSVTVVRRERYGSPSETIVDFSSGDTSGSWQLRRPSYYIPQNVWPLGTQPTFAMDAEPEYIAVNQDETMAYIILQKNSAIAKLDLKKYEVTIGNIPRKEWTSMTMDGSDRDGGVHLREYPLQSIRQPDNAKILRIGRTDYLITADEGRTSTYSSSLQGFNWADHQPADQLTRAQKLDVPVINNQTFIDALTTDTKAGRLQLSVTDGFNPFTQKIQRATHFGGRGFSIWNTGSMSLVYDSRDEIEKMTALMFPDVFNSDCVKSTITYQSPANLKDTTSDDLGPKLNALDVIEDTDNTFLLTGSETSGVLFLYTVNTTSGYPIPKFESAHRAGLTDYVWKELYDMNQAGDAKISDIGLIKSSQHRANKTMAYVIGKASGSVSLYEIKHQTADPTNTFG